MEPQFLIGIGNLIMAIDYPVKSNTPDYKFWIGLVNLITDIFFIWLAYHLWQGIKDGYRGSSQTNGQKGQEKTHVKDQETVSGRVFGDAVSTLTSLGFSHKKSKRAIGEALKTLKNPTTQELVKAALNKIKQKNETGE